MAFFDKLTEIAKNVGDKTAEIAKNVGDKTSDMLEIGKISAQISSSNSAVEELKTRLGDHYWELFTKGEQLDDDAVVLCNTIKEYTEEIEALKAQLAELKAGGAQPSDSRPCHVCGTVNTSDASFCKNCGAKLEAEKPEQEAGAAVEAPAEEHEECTCCHSEEQPAAEEAAPIETEEAPVEETAESKVCPNCGAENTSDNNFCNQCGSKL